MLVMMSPPSENEDRPKKKMRKGTHSCISCRRRKIRCVFLPDAQTCNDCLSRGSQCIDQESADAFTFVPSKKKKRSEQGSTSPAHSASEMGAAEALRKLQSELMRSSIKKTANGGVNRPMTIPIREHAAPVEPNFSTDPTENNAPLLSIFNNSIISHNSEEPIANSPPSIKAPESRANKKINLVVEALRALAPNKHDLKIIIQASSAWAELWTRSFPEVVSPNFHEPNTGGVENLSNFICDSINSDNLGVICKILVCLAVSLQQLPSTFCHDEMTLPAPADTLQDHYMTAVETILGSDEDFAATLEGLECTMLQVKFYVNVGKPRKAWLNLRRSISYAQLLGCHRQKCPTTAEPSALARRKHSTWFMIWQGDRVLSLILGLPYACPDSQFNADFPLASSGSIVSGEKIMVRLSLVCGHVIDCTQDAANANFAQTMKVDQELEECAAIMPPEWWESGLTTSLSDEEVYDKFVAITMYHNVRKLLHLPFMLKSFTDKRYDYSRNICMQSSREMIKAYRILRDFNRPILTLCNLVDFVVFTAAMVIVLDLFSHCVPSSKFDLEEEQSDWKIIEGIAWEFERVSRLQNCSVATQASRLLGDILEGRRQGCDGSDCGDCDAVIPYFGRIKLRRGKAFGPTPAMTHSSSATVSSAGINSQLQTPSESTLCDFSIDPQTGVPADPMIDLSFDGSFPSLDFAGGQNLWGDCAPLDWTGANANGVVSQDLDSDWSWLLNGNSS